MEDILNTMTTDGIIIKYLADKLNLGYDIYLDQDEIDEFLEYIRENGIEFESESIENICINHINKISFAKNRLYIVDDKIYPTHFFGELDSAVTNFSQVDLETQIKLDKLIEKFLSKKNKRAIEPKMNVEKNIVDESTKAIDLYINFINQETDLDRLKEFKKYLIDNTSSLLSMDENLRISSLSRFPLAHSNYLALTREYEDIVDKYNYDMDLYFPKKRLTLYDQKVGKCYYFKD